MFGWDQLTQFRVEGPMKLRTQALRRTHSCDQGPREWSGTPHSVQLSQSVENHPAVTIPASNEGIGSPTYYTRDAGRRALVGNAPAMLTHRQRRVLIALEKEVARNQGVAPSISELTRALGYRSTSSTHTALLELETRGLIRRQPGKARGIEVLCPTTAHC